MSVKIPVTPKGELPHLSVEELNFVFDLVKKHNVPTEEAYRRAKEIDKNKRNGDQKRRPADPKEQKKHVKKPPSSVSSNSSVTSISAPIEIQQKTHNYGVSTPGGRRTLQIDFVSKTITIFSGGQIQQAYMFLDLRSYDVDESIANELILRFDDSSYDINTDSREEKYGIERLLSTILELNDLERIGVNLNQTGSVVAPQQKVIKKGELMKRGNTAIPVWAKRVVKIQTGEFCFYRAGDAVALNVVRMWEGNAKVKAKGNDGIVIQMRAPDTRTFVFRVCSDGHQDTTAIKEERNDWLKAFKKACITRRSTLKLSKDQIKRLNAQYDDEGGKRKHESVHGRMYIAEGQFTSQISPVGPNSSAGSIGYSTGRSTESFTESPGPKPPSSPNNVYDFVRDEAIGSSSEDDSTEFDDDTVFYNNVRGPYSHQEAEVLGLLENAISIGDETSLQNDKLIYSNVPNDAPPPCPKNSGYAKRITHIEEPTPKKDAAPGNGIVITTRGQDISWQPDTNEVTEIIQAVSPVPLLPVPAPPSIAPPPIAPPPIAPPPPPLAQLRDCSSRIRLKHVFWRPVPENRIQDSIWQNSKPEDIQKKLSLGKLEELFSTAQSKPIISTSNQTQPSTLITGKRAYNLGIFLRGLKTRGPSLVKNLSEVYEERSALSVEQVATIRRFQPTVEDCEMYGNFKGNKAKLGEVDQFMMELSHIPELGNRLDLTQLLWDFPHQLHCLEPTVEYMIRACNQLKLSQKFARILQYILCLGNFLNSSSPSGAVVKGFNITVLGSLADTRGKDKEYSLLHYLVEQLISVEPDLLTFAKEIPDISKCSDASTKGLEVEIEVLKNQLALIKKTARSVRAGLIHPTPYEHKFIEDAEKFAKDHDKMLQELQTHHNQLYHVYLSVLARFGQPIETSSNNLFGAIAQFVEKIDQVQKEIALKKESISSQKSNGKPRVPLPQKKR